MLADFFDLGSHDRAGWKRDVKALDHVPAKGVLRPDADAQRVWAALLEGERCRVGIAQHATQYVFRRVLTLHSEKPRALHSARLVLALLPAVARRRASGGDHGDAHEDQKDHEAAGNGADVPGGLRLLGPADRRRLAGRDGAPAARAACGEVGNLDRALGAGMEDHPRAIGTIPPGMKLLPSVGEVPAKEAGSGR